MTLQIFSVIWVIQLISMNTSIFLFSSEVSESSSVIQRGQILMLSELELKSSPTPILLPTQKAA